MDGSSAPGFRQRPWWLLAVALVTVGQARLALAPFGSADGIADPHPIVAARGLGLSAAGSCLAGVLGCVVWWSPPARALLDAGHLDLLLAGLMALAFVGALARYAADPGPASWMLMAAV